MQKIIEQFNTELEQLSDLVKNKDQEMNITILVECFENLYDLAMEIFKVVGHQLGFQSDFPGMLFQAGIQSGLIDYDWNVVPYYHFDLQKDDYKPTLEQDLPRIKECHGKFVELSKNMAIMQKEEAIQEYDQEDAADSPEVPDTYTGEDLIDLNEVMEILEDDNAEKMPTSNYLEAIKDLDTLKKKATEGDPQAQSFLGLAYVNAIGVEWNPKKGIKWWRKAAKQGHPEAIFNLGCAYLDGNDVEWDVDLGVKLLEQAAQNGYAPAMYRLGCMYADGDDVEQDFNKAHDLFQQAANNGHSESVKQLAIMYYMGDGVDEDREKAMKLFCKAAKLGDPVALNILASLYLNGENVKPNKQIAIKLFSKSADLGDSDAIYHLGKILFFEEGEDSDCEKGLEYIQTAADNGHADALFDLGVIYLLGLSVEKDRDKAIRSLFKAETRGSEKASIMLEKYRNGELDKYL